MSPILQLVSSTLKEVMMLLKEGGEKTLLPNFAPLKDMLYRRTSLADKDVRQNLSKYFNSPGQVPWQWGILVRKLWLS